MKSHQSSQADSLGTLLPLEKKIIWPAKTRPKKVILLAGPTACGKTTLSLMLADMLKGEIVSADSMQVYKGMDIGTAKISKEAQEKIPHHLIDIRHVQESFNVVDFYYEAKQACESILARDCVPIVVGGSGFYFHALIYGPPEGPPSVPDLRHELEEEMQEVGPEAMFAKLLSIDPAYAATITHNDRHKIIRALEIATLTGEKVSSFKKRTVPIPDYDFFPWFIYRPRTVLYPMIDERCDQMLASGFIDEVIELEKQGIRSNPSASQAIGYRQCLEFLQTDRSDSAYADFVKKFKTASRHYAKRQFTWFRKETPFKYRWLNIDIHDFEIAADVIAQDFTSI